MGHLLVIHCVRTRAELNYAGSRFPLETCPGSHPDAGLTSISLHSLTLPHLGSVHAQCYPPVAAAVGRRGSEKPEALDIGNKSECELGWTARGLTFKHMLGNGPFRGPHIESPQGESEVVFSNSGICFPPKGTTGRNKAVCKTRVTSETSGRRETKKQGDSFQRCIDTLFLENLREALAQSSLWAGAGSFEDPFQRLSALGTDGSHIHKI